MAMSLKEIELKLALTPLDFSALKAHPTFAELLSHPIRTERQISTYFDTDQRDLHNHGMTLRVRNSGNEFLQTIKSAAAGTFERDEWERTLPDGYPNLDFAANTALEPLLTPEVRAALRPIFETRIKRTYYHLADSAWQIEIAYDHGEIVAGNRSLPVCEIELELKHGYRAALFELARMIIEIVPARLTFAAKADRAYHLLDDKPPQSFSAEKIVLMPGTATADAFKTIASGCLDQIIANTQVIHKRNPEALHQVRIGLRRLRTAISLFSDIVRDGRVEWIKSELRWLNGELAPTRDLDTLFDEVMKPLREQHPKHRGLQRLNYTLLRRRLKNYRLAEKAVQSPRFCKLLVEAFAWIEVGEWITTTDEQARLRREQTIEFYAADQLSRRRRKIRKRGRQLVKLDPERRHRLRIQIKKTRYATEFFASLFTERKAERRSKKLLNVLKRLQNSLGGLNDVMARNRLCAEILSEIERSPQANDGRERAFAAGLVAGNQEARQDELLSDAAKAHAEFEAIKPFWK